MNKKTFKPNKRQAFSLIELSIVLIIIGLLIAGVTGGASLIKNAELRKITEEARGYQTAVNSFYAKYNGLPGDYNGGAIGSLATAPSTVMIGDGNGLISFVAGPAGIAAAGRLEGNTAWLMLKNDNFINDSFTPGATDLAAATPFTVALTGGTNVPGSKSKGGGWAFDNITVNSATQNVVILFGGSTSPLITTVPVTGTAYNMLTAAAATVALSASTAATSTGNAQVLATDALSIDSKVDDGVANTGKVSTVTNGNITGLTTCGTTGLNPGTGATQCLSCTGSGANVGNFATTTSFKSCALAFQVDPNS